MNLRAGIPQAGDMGAGGTPAAGRTHFLPQAIIQRPPSFFAARGVSFRTDHDDLDEYELAEIRDGSLVFVLLRYRGAPGDETTLFLPDHHGLPDLPALVARILARFGLPAEAVAWQRRMPHTPF